MKGTTLAWGFGAFAGALLLAPVLQSANLGHAPWYISRASGLVAFALLSGSVILGLTISSKASKSFIPRTLAFDLHQFLSVLALTFVGIHAGSLLFDGFLRFSPAQILVPFASPYRPLATGAGIVAAWIASLVTASFWLRKRVGYRAWRRFHYLSFAAYVLGLVHGVTAGTDSGLPLVGWMYILSAATVAALLVYRIGSRNPERPTKSRGATANSGRTVRAARRA